MVLIAWNTGYGLKQKYGLCILKLSNFTDTITYRLRFNDTNWQLILDLLEACSDNFDLRRYNISKTTVRALSLRRVFVGSRDSLLYITRYRGNI